LHLTAAAVLDSVLVNVYGASTIELPASDAPTRKVLISSTPDQGTVSPMEHSRSRRTASRIDRPVTQALALSGGDAVLGLLIERPANSYQLERRLASRFGSAHFAHGTAYHAVRRLSSQGLIRTVGPEPAPLQAVEHRGPLRATDYEATPRGVEHFRSWLRASPSTPPVREELLAKIAFCGPSDLPRMIEIVRDAELACAAQLKEVNERMRTARRLAGDDPWRRLMSLIVTAGDVAWWDSRIKWLQELRRYLQEEGRRYQAAGGHGPTRPPR
jgi:DNA-binding PadR family transcriptional regulator